MKDLITQERLKELLSYDKDTGIFIWLVSTSNRVKVGDVAGHKNDKGYTVIRIDDRLYLIHRLAWLYINGYHSEYIIDHRDRDPSNNRIVNLREASLSCNARNSRTSDRNTSTIKGVNWFKRTNRWRSYLSIGGKQIHLGFHRDIVEAACYRLAAEQAEDWEGCYSDSSAYTYVKAHLGGG